MPLEDPLDHVHPPHPNDWIYFSDAAGDVLGSLTPPAWLSALFDTVLGADPLTWVELQFGGDWAEVSTASNMFLQFADWLDITHHNTGERAWSMTDSWEGNAALAARAQLLEAQLAIEDAPGLLREMAAAGEWVASRMFATKTIVSEALSAVITLAVSAVVPPVILTLIPKILKWLTDIVAWAALTVQGITVAINGLSGASQRLAALPVIDLGLGYDNPLHS